VERIGRLTFAAVLALHGIVHWIGFAVPLGLVETPSNRPTTEALWGTLDGGETGARILGIAYLALIVPFLVAAYGVARGRSWALPLTIDVASLSAIVCALGSPNAVVGLLLNLVIIAIAVAWLRLRPTTWRLD
jgi:hypothetical protein